MVTKKVCIAFADPRIKVEDHLNPDICDAIARASHNLYCRYKIKLQMPSITKDKYLRIELEIPDERVENFNIGRHLRGLSIHLLKSRPEYYKQYLVGKRLLYYWEIE